MNYWIITTVAATAMLITSLILDNRMIRKLTESVNAYRDDVKHWKRKCEELRMDISFLEERDAKQIAHLVLIRDEEIEHLKRTMSEMETKHRRELDLREKRIYTLEKKADDKRIEKAGEQR